MGTPKAALEWHGSTLLRRTVGILARVTDGPIVVVRAPGQDLPALPRATEVVDDPREGLGPVQGLAAGLAAVADRAEVAFVSSTDMPFLHPAFVRRVLRAAVGSMITALQTMPSIAWFPFVIILFGATTNAILFVIVLGAAPSIANGLITGVDYTPPLLLRAGRTMGLGRIAMYRHLILPASLPSFVAGLKQGWAFAWRSLMAGELLVIILGQPSIGALLSTYQDQSDIAGAIAIMIVILVLGLVVDTIFTRVDATIRRRRGMLDAAVT